MRDIAQRAGVHPSTVSLALRNHPAISAATRQSIQKVAREAGYHRDPLLDAFNARRAAAGQHRSFPVIAIVADFASVDEISVSPLHAALWRGMAKAAQLLFHHAELFPLGRGGLTPDRLNSVLYARGIGCVVAAALRNEAAPLRLGWDRYCAVKVECLDWPAPHFTVAADILQGTRLAVRQARDFGYHRIALATNARKNLRNDLVRAGYLFELSQMAGRNEPIQLAFPDNPKPRALGDWIQSQRIDAILSDIPDFGATLGISGSTPAGRVGFASLNPAASGAVAGIAADYERIGALAIEQVVSLSRINQRGASSSAMITYVPVAWRTGPSLPRRSWP